MAITYPRKCPHCEYEANNPQAYSYHKRKHKEIPTGTLCSHGCGGLANYTTTNNTYTCSEKYSQCPAHIEKLSKSAKESWDNDPKRKENMKVNGPMSTTEAREKISSIQKAKWKQRLVITENEAPHDMKQYKRLVHNLSQRTYRENIETINPNNFTISRTTYHLDHKVSKHVGWLLHIPAKYLASVENLELLPSTINEGKGAKCSIKPSDLLIKCNAPQDLIDQVVSQEILLKHLFE